MIGKIRENSCSSGHRSAIGGTFLGDLGPANKGQNSPGRPRERRNVDARSNALSRFLRFKL